LDLSRFDAAFLIALSGKGHRRDTHAAVERSFKTIKAALIWRDTWTTLRHGEMAIFEYLNGF